MSLPDGELAIGDLVEVEVVGHAPWGVTVRLLPPAPDVPASIDLLSRWHEQGVLPAAPDRWPVVGTTLEAVFERWSGKLARLTVRPAALAIAHADWAVVVNARVAMAPSDQGGVREPIPSGGSRLVPVFASSRIGSVAVVETWDGTDLLPGAHDVEVRLKLWPETSPGELAPGTPFILRYEGSDRLPREVGSGRIVAPALAGYKHQTRPPCVFADWNTMQLDGGDDVPLGDIWAHRDTDFAVLEGRAVLLWDSDEVVEAVIVRDEDGRWVGRPDWSTKRDIGEGEAWPDTHPAIW